MAALPRNNTNILTVEYTNGLDNHTLSVRYRTPDATLEVAKEAVASLFLAVESALYTGFTYVSARNQVIGTTFSVPTSVPTPAPTPGGTTITEIEAPVSVTIPGRSTGGRANSLELYAFGISVPSDFLFVRGESATIDALLDYLQGLAPVSAPVGTFVTIDNFDTIWYDRATVNYNDYWVRQARR